MHAQPATLLEAAADAMEITKADDDVFQRLLSKEFVPPPSKPSLELEMLQARLYDVERENDRLKDTLSRERNRRAGRPDFGFMGPAPRLRLSDEMMSDYRNQMITGLGLESVDSDPSLLCPICGEPCPQ